MKFISKIQALLDFKHHLGRTTAVTIAFVLVVGLTTHLLVSQYVLRKAEGNIRDVLQSHRGLHQYVQKVMHPAVYAALNAGKIEGDYYAPEIFSSSFIVRVMHSFINEERKKAKEPEIYYKMASTNPRNPLNMADEREVKLIALFNQHRDRKEYREVVTIHDRKFLYYAIPFIETNIACLKCHGKREDAPLGLQRLYPGEGGFNEKAGVIRAVESIRAPLDQEITFTYILTATLSTGIIVPLGLLGFNSRLRNLVRVRTNALEEEIVERQRVQDSLHEQTLKLEKEIARRLEAQEGLQKSESHLRVVADHSSNWEYWRLPDNSFMYMSPSVHAITGYTVEDFVNDGDLLTNVIDPGDRELFQCHTHQFGEDGRILPIEMRIVCKSGEVRWMGHVCTQVLTPDGQPWGWRASNQDITVRKQLEHELCGQRAQLEILNRSLKERVFEAVADLRRKDQTLIQQSRFAAMGEMVHNIAHQWRQPLNNVGLIVQTLQYKYEQGDLSIEEMKAEVDTTMDIIQLMSQTIDDFRNFFRDDKQKRDFHVKDVLKQTLDLISARLKNRKILVDIEAQGEVTAFGYVNEYSHVLLNILNNASDALTECRIDAPRIRIRVFKEQARSVVTIWDNGGGVDPEILPLIFDPYFTTKEHGKGTGIGLYMSKSIIEQNMGGRLTARNVDDGAEIRIEV